MKGRMMICMLLAVGLLVPQQAALGAGRKHKADTVASATKKTPFEKFSSKKGLQKAQGVLDIWQDGKDTWLGVPDSLMGREFILSTVVRQSGDHTFYEGKELSKNPVYRLARTDSCILLQKSRAYLDVADCSESILRALDRSKAYATVMSFPVKYRNADSTECFVKATKLFSPSSKEAVNMGEYYGGLSLSSADFKEERSSAPAVKAVGRSVGVEREATWEMNLKDPLTGQALDSKPAVTARIFTSVTLMDTVLTASRKVDPSVGTYPYQRRTYRADGGSKVISYARKWNLDGDRRITVWVDPAFDPAWRKAIKEGVEAWNDAFVSAGMGPKIECRVADDSVDFGNPLITKVMAIPTGLEDMKCSILPDGCEILGATISVGANYYDKVWKQSNCLAGDFDPRFADYDIPEEAVCEYAKADIMRLMGSVLGLTPNMAGSRMYSPQQLRDPAFTRAHGITGSVTDDAVFNIFARPGDRERGLVTMVDRIGDYDRHAIAWLYAGAEPDHTLEYAAAGSGDYRAKEHDLGNDDIAAFQAIKNHVRYAYDHGLERVAGTPDSYRELYIDWVFLHYKQACAMLSANIGGVAFNDLPSDGMGKYSPLGLKTQRECIGVLAREMSDTRWLDAHRELFTTCAGANKSVSNYVDVNKHIFLGYFKRWLPVFAAHAYMGGGLTPDEYFDSVEDVIFAGLRKGKFYDNEPLTVLLYLNQLMKQSPYMVAAQKSVTDPAGTSFSDGESFRTDGTAVPAEILSEMEGFCMRRMEKALSLLKSCRGKFSGDTDRGMVDYMIFFCESALYGKKD